MTTETEKGLAERVDAVSGIDNGFARLIRDLWNEIDKLRGPAAAYPVACDEIEKMQQKLARWSDLYADVRSYTHDWDWKYGNYWDKECDELRDAQ